MSIQSDHLQTDTTSQGVTDVILSVVDVVVDGVVVVLDTVVG